MNFLLKPCHGNLNHVNSFIAIVIKNLIFFDIYDRIQCLPAVTGKTKSFDWHHNTTTFKI